MDKTGAMWAERIAAGERYAIARAISALENETAQAPAVRAALAGRLGHSRILGVTGPPGSGKSTLANALVGAFLGGGLRVAVVAVDPSSPVSGGAVLGDRIRMTEHQENERVYIRSLAARGHLGGLTRTVRGVIDVLDAAHFDIVIVETVGAGQSEVEIAGVAETKLVVCPPDLGDEVQAIKAGLLEIADIYVVNKSDLPRAVRTEEALRSMLALRKPSPWTPPIVRSVATTGEGIALLHGEIGRHQAWLGERRVRQPAAEEIRYLRLRADTLMGMFHHLPAAARAQALAALARSTAEHGGDSARRYLQSGGGDAAALLARVEKSAGELGWGRWRFGEREAMRLALEVAESPFPEGYGAADTEVCAPITGMLQAVAELVLGAQCEARETGCRARGAKLCRFEAVTRKDA
ncbi:MAG: methylmalonyl Co-A mutase-associated GTPase MeaB [Betaproteobacteria bacterium]|nr:methylmalonyl Co-A mutase-associated GTPase MeaB [Betaproteobacteria bacterium]